MKKSKVDKGNDKETELTNRRRRVGELHLEGYSYQKIADQLANEGFLINGKAPSKATIKLDMDKVCEEWFSEISDKVSRNRANHLQMAQHLYRKALQAEDLKLALECLKTMIRLLGTEMPARHEISGGDNPVVISVLPAGMWENL